ncbi:MAG: hypothetical protein AWU55_2350 [Halomonadaceae bacterium T82-2]|nr:MAG: hypothetical protein AWU55_2350 [Halomonadaceae bacterium T82-2]
MAFRTDDPTLRIEQPQPKEDSMTTEAQERTQARIDHDQWLESQRPKTSRDVRADKIERDARGDNAGQGASDARQQMIDRMKGDA